MGISDLIASFLKESLDEAEDGVVEVQRNDLAQRFNCVPSQINYVMSTRFSPERGYIVESRRGGNGYIRITRVRVDRQTLLMHVINSLGERMDLPSARAILSNLVQSGALEESLGRALLADPFLPEKVMANRDEEIVRCLRCFTCMAERAATATRRCTVNPLIGRELEGDRVLPAPEKKKVLVAGGGPGGLYAAWTAARRGHQVILCEKEDSLGGILRSEQALPFKYEMYQLAGTYAHLARKAGVEIRLNTEVTAAYVEREAPDALIIAVGSRPLLPPIPGLKGDNVVVVNNYYKEKDKVGEDVVVFGGGLAGCECAIHLGQEGKTVHIVEMRDALAPDANVRHRPLLLKEVEKYATVHTGCRGLEVRPDGIWCEDREGRQFLVPGKSVIAALGQRSCSDIVEELQDGAPFVRIIGDAARVSTITNAVYWGYHAALDI